MTEVTPSDISPDRAKHVEEFLQEYVMSINKKRTKQLLAMSNSGFEAFKLSVRVSRCCRVRIAMINYVSLLIETLVFGFGQGLSVLPRDQSYGSCAE